MSDEPRFALVVYRPALVGRGDSRRWVPGWRAEAHQPAWQELCRSMTRFRRAPSKAETWSWSPVSLDGDRRRNDAVISLSCLVLDLDDGADLHEASERFGSWPHIVHTTWSHTPERPKGRIILPLEEPCPARWWPRVWQWGQRQAGLAADEQAKDASRVYFLPAVGSAEQAREAWVHDPGGYLLDLRPWEDLPDTPAERAARRVLPPRRWRGGAPDSDRARQQTLKEDPAARERLALSLGGRVMSGYARGVPCPGCGRPAVWWAIEPARMMGAACSHRNSCGWHGWLDELEAG